jgi:HEAT repeat protein
MKRLFALFALALAAAASFADETTEIYRTLYEQAEGLQQKHAAVLNLVSLNDKTTAPIIASALEELLLQQKSYASRVEVDLYGRTVRVLAKALGDYKYAPAAPFLWDVAQQVPEPLAKAEALMAIGKMRNLEYAERIALMLRDLNMQPSADRDAGEKVAYGAIVALDKLKDIRGFSPVFFAADSWYSQRVRQQAVLSLPNISDDPTEPIKEILAAESSPERRLRALSAEISSKAPPERKIETAVLALSLGHLKSPRDQREAKGLADMRKMALRALVAYKASGPDPVDGCVASFGKGFDDEERLLGLAALGSNGSDPSAGALRGIILKMNDEQKSGISDEVRVRMAKAAMENAGVSKNKLLKPALLAVSMNDRWSSGVLLAAQAALKAIP